MGIAVPVPKFRILNFSYRYLGTSTYSCTKKELYLILPRYLGIRSLPMPYSTYLSHVPSGTQTTTVNVDCTKFSNSTRTHIAKFSTTFCYFKVAKKISCTVIWRGS